MMIEKELMIKSIQPQLMFTGSAKQAMDLYVSVFGGKVVDEQFYPDDHPTQSGQVLRAMFLLGEQIFTCIDSAPVHEFSFTPSMSIFIEMENAAVLEQAFEALAEGGQVLMPLDSYGFSEKFVWFDDKYGVSWQLSYG